MANTHSLDLESGSSQYASRADTASLSITGDLTIEAWIKRESAGAQMSIVGKWDFSTNLRSYSFEFTSGNNLTFGVSTNGTAQTFANNSTALSSTGVWIHIAVAYDASAGQAFFYVDAASDGSPTGLGASIHDNASTFAIGASDSGNTPTIFFDGLIDEVRVWSDIRTAQEILDNYKTELEGNEANLVAYYKLNNSYNDETANANNLTASGSPVFSTDMPNLDVNKSYAFFM